ncbi:gamma-Secretase-activating protein C-term [Pelomyxa schiedti]|nr:gamma-Secretase-activating protein C-term [Pelomyxa schiedti]
MFGVSEVFDVNKLALLLPPEQLPAAMIGAPLGAQQAPATSSTTSSQLPQFLGPAQQQQTQQQPPPPQQQPGTSATILMSNAPANANTGGSNKQTMRITLVGRERSGDILFAVHLKTPVMQQPQQQPGHSTSPASLSSSTPTTAPGRGFARPDRGATDTSPPPAAASLSLGLSFGGGPGMLANSHPSHTCQHPHLGSLMGGGVVLSGPPTIPPPHLPSNGADGQTPVVQASSSQTPVSAESLGANTGPIPGIGRMSKRTFLNVHKVGSRVCTKLAVWEEEMDIVNASINDTHSLFAVTVRKHRKDGVKWISFLYENCLLGKHHTLLDHDLYLQVQFVTDTVVRSQVDTTFLFFVESEAIKFYRVRYKVQHNQDKTIGSMTLVEKPEKLGQIAPDYLWAQLDVERQHIYTVTSLPDERPLSTTPPLATGIPSNASITSGNGAAAQSSNALGVVSSSSSSGFPYQQAQLLSCWVFSRDQWTQAWNHIVDLPTVLYPRQLTFPIPFELGRPIAQAVAHATMVSLLTSEARSSTITCLCIQHQVREDPPVLPITIIVFNGIKKRLDFSINLTSLHPSSTITLEEVHVLFSSIEGYLVVWLPGHVIHLFDLSDTHHICAGPFVFGEDACPVHVGMSLRKSTSATQPQIVVPLHLVIPGTKSGSYFLDCHSGVVYDFSWDKGHLLKMFEQSDSEVFMCQILHLVCVHLKNGESDMGTARTLITRLLSSNAGKLTPDLLKEYLLGRCFRQALAGPASEKVLRHFPASTLKLLESSQMHKTLLNASVHSLDPHKAKPSKNVTFGLEQNPSSFPASMFTLPTIAVPLFTPSRNPLLLLFPSKKTTEPVVTCASEEDYQCCALPSTIFKSEMTSRLVGCGVKDGERNLHPLITAFREDNISFTTEMFETIKNLVQSRLMTDSSLFQILHHLYIAMEDLCFPFPKGFHTLFITTGFRCLPPHVFLQYINRGLFVVTKEFVKECILPAKHLSPGFRNCILSKIPGFIVPDSSAKCHAAHRFKFLVNFPEAALSGHVSNSAVGTTTPRVSHRGTAAASSSIILTLPTAPGVDVSQLEEAKFLPLVIYRQMFKHNTLSQPNLYKRFAKDMANCDGTDF